MVRTWSAAASMPCTASQSWGVKSLANSERVIGRMACQESPLARACRTNSWSLPPAMEDSAIHSPGTSRRSASSAPRIARAAPAESVRRRWPVKPTMWNCGSLPAGAPAAGASSGGVIVCSGVRRRGRLHRELPLGAESVRPEFATHPVSDLLGGGVAAHADDLAHHAQHRNGDRHFDDGLAEARHAAARVADSGREGPVLDLELDVGAVVADRRRVRVLHAQLDQEPELESLALLRHRLDARDCDLQRVTAVHRRAAAQRECRKRYCQDET